MLLRKLFFPEKSHQKNLIIFVLGTITFSCKPNAQGDGQNHSATLAQSPDSPNPPSQAPQIQWRGSMRVVKPNQWACLAWTVADVTQYNSIFEDILRREPKTLTGSHLITMTNSKFFVDYSSDPVTAGQNINGAWGDCPVFEAAYSDSSSQTLQIRSSVVHSASPPDGNGQKMIPHQIQGKYCATAQDGRVMMNPCNPDDDNQKWLWDGGKNGGYGYIKLAKNPNLCMDIPQGGANINVGRAIILHRCKSFAAGPGAASNNQRFWLDGENQ